MKNFKIRYICLLLCLATLFNVSQNTAAENVNQKLAPSSILADGSYINTDTLLKIRANLKSYFNALNISKTNNIDHKLFAEALKPEFSAAHKIAIQQIYYSTNEEVPEIQQFIQAIKQDAANEGFMIAVSSGGIDFSMAINGNPDKMIIMDINPLVVNGYFPLLSSLICSSDNRLDFLCKLSGRNFNSLTDAYKKQTLQDGIDNLKQLTEQVPTDEAVLENNQLKLKSFFSEEDQLNLTYSQEILSYVFKRGQGQIKRLLEKMDFPESWLYSEESFQKTKDFLMQGKLFGFHADMAKEIPESLLKWISQQGQIKSMYFSNLMDYFRQSDQVENFIKNIHTFSSHGGQLNMPLFFGSQLNNNSWGAWNKTLKEWFDISG